MRICASIFETGGSIPKLEVDASCVVDRFVREALVEARLGFVLDVLVVGRYIDLNYNYISASGHLVNL